MGSGVTFLQRSMTLVMVLDYMEQYGDSQIRWVGSGAGRGACFKSHSTAHFSLFATYVRAYSTHHNG